MTETLPAPSGTDGRPPLTPGPANSEPAPSASRAEAPFARGPAATGAPSAGGPRPVPRAGSAESAEFPRVEATRRALLGVRTQPVTNEARQRLGLRSTFGRAGRRPHSRLAGREGRDTARCGDRRGQRHARRIAARSGAARRTSGKPRRNGNHLRRRGRDAASESRARRNARRRRRSPERAAAAGPPAQPDNIAAPAGPGDDHADVEALKRRVQELEQRVRDLEQASKK